MNKFQHLPANNFDFHSNYVIHLFDQADVLSSSVMHIFLLVILKLNRNIYVLTIQFKTAKRPQAPSDATVRKRFFHDNFLIFRRRLKRIAFLKSVNFSTCVRDRDASGYCCW